MFFTKEQTALWIVDVQEKLFPLMDQKETVLGKMCLMLEAAKLLKLPLVVTEQYPEGLGKTIDSLRQKLPKGQKIESKSTFSGYVDSKIRKIVEETRCTSWILMGIEAHICVLQTAKDLINAGKNVAVLGDAVSARSHKDISLSFEELKSCKARVVSVESMIYEIVRDAKSIEFKEILSLIKCA